MITTEFEKLMMTIAEGWNSGNAKIAVACFSEDAIYIEPPDKQLIQGRDKLYDYFGGDAGADMKLTWHNLFFNEAKQSGAGEYTFEMNGTVHHGVAVVDIKNDLINFWREYDVAGSLSYGDFLKTDGKDFKFTGKDLLK
jgi:hypothetical protein